eukprot:971607-Alexandrium_andersonii.AAC.1
MENSLPGRRKDPTPAARKASEMRRPRKRRRSKEASRGANVNGESPRLNRRDWITWTGQSRAAHAS